MGDPKWNWEYLGGGLLGSDRARGHDARGRGLVQEHLELHEEHLGLEEGGLGQDTHGLGQGFDLGHREVLTALKVNLVEALGGENAVRVLEVRVVRLT